LGSTAYDYNDAKGRTASEVIATLRDAADEWDLWLPQATATLHRLLAEAADMRLIRSGGAA
jgi:hypothetical protein